MIGSEQQGPFFLYSFGLIDHNFPEKNTDGDPGNYFQVVVKQWRKKGGFGRLMIKNETIPLEVLKMALQGSLNQRVIERKLRKILRPEKRFSPFI